MPTNSYCLTAEEKKALDRAERQIAFVLRQSMSRHHYRTQIKMAAFLRVSRRMVSAFEKGDIEQLSFNQLFRFLARMEPNFRILINPELPLLDEDTGPPSV